jgi:hypothetical protein
MSHEARQAMYIGLYICCHLLLAGMEAIRRLDLHRALRECLQHASATSL